MHDSCLNSKTCMFLFNFFRSSFSSLMNRCKYTTKSSSLARCICNTQHEQRWAQSETATFWHVVKFVQTLLKTTKQ